MLPFTRALLVGATLASSAAAQAPGPPDPVLAREGITAVRPAGFPAFAPHQPRSSPPGFRWYRSRSGARVITVCVVDARAGWGGDDDGDVRRWHLRLATEAFNETAVGEPEVRMHADSMHLSSTSRAALESDRFRAVTRVYVPRTGAPQTTAIQVLDVSGLVEQVSDPADDPGIMAFLDAARPGVTDGRAAAPLTFREASVELAMAPGITMPVELYRDMDEGARGFHSRNGTRNLMVLVIRNLQPGADTWPPERRVRHMQQAMDRILGPMNGRSRLPAFDSGGLTARDFPFTRMPREGAVTGRGRMYTTTSGSHFVVAVMYYETGRDASLDEREVAAMLDSLRVLPSRSR